MGKLFGEIEDVFVFRVALSKGFEIICELIGRGADALGAPTGIFDGGVRARKRMAWLGPETIFLSAVARASTSSFVL